MSLTININLPDVDAGGQGGVSRAALDLHLDALGFKRDAVLASMFLTGPAVGEAIKAIKTEHGIVPVNAEDDQTASTTTRERGKPSGGRARRTKEEIAEDEAAEKADAANGTTQGISTGETRAAPDDDPETDAQDAADEAADAANVKTVELTVDDLRDVMGEYVKKFTMEATQEDGAKIFTAALGTPPNGEEGWKVSSVVAAGRVGEAIAAWRKAVGASKRFGA